MGFSVNGTAVNVFGSYGSSYQVTANDEYSFTLTWSGIPTSGGSQTMLNLAAIHKTDRTPVNLACPSVQNSPNTQVYLSWVGSFASDAWAYLDGCTASGSLTFTSAIPLVDIRLDLGWSYNGSDPAYDYGSCYVYFIDPTPQACIAPSDVSVTPAESSGEAVQLRFTEGSGNRLNDFVDYQIQYSDNASSTPAGSSATWSDLTTGTSSPVNVSVPAAIPVYRSFRIRTRGSAGPDYYSPWAYSSNTVLRSFTVSKPTAHLISSSGSRCEAYVFPSSEITGATGTITYEWYRSGSSTVLLTTTDPNTHLVVPESELTSFNQFYVKASATVSGITKSSNSDPVTFTYDPTFTDASNLRISQDSGLSATLTWTPGSLSSGGTVTHQLAVSRDSGMTYTVLSANASTPYVITQEALEALGVQEGDALIFQVIASGNGNTGIPLTVSFTYTAASGNHIYAHFFNGTEFIPCVIDQWDGTQWVRCRADYFDGTEFV